MLQKQYRLPAATRLKNPRSFNTPAFFLKVSPNDLEISRFGFVVRKAVDKRATARNRIKRVLRSCIEEMLDEFLPGQDLLFMLKGSILEMKRQDLYNEVHTLFKEKQLLK